MTEKVHCTYSFLLTLAEKSAVYQACINYTCLIFFICSMSVSLVSNKSLFNIATFSFKTYASFFSGIWASWLLSHVLGDKFVYKTYSKLRISGVVASLEIFFYEPILGLLKLLLNIESASKVWLLRLRSNCI